MDEKSDILLGSPLVLLECKHRLQNVKSENIILLLVLN